MCSLKLFQLIDDVIDDFVCDADTFTAYDVTLAVRQRTQEIFYHNQVKQYIHDAMDSYMWTGKYKRQQSSKHPSYEYVPNMAHPTPQPKKASVPTQHKYVKRGGLANCEFHPITNKCIYCGYLAKWSQTKRNCPKRPTNLISLVDSRTQVDSKTHSKTKKAKTCQCSTQPTKHQPTTQSFNRYPDRRWSITIPKVCVQALGLKPGDTAHVSISNNIDYVSTSDNKVIISQDSLYYWRFASASYLTSYTVDKNSNIRVTKHVLQHADRSKGYYNVTIQNDCIVIS